MGNFHSDLLSLLMVFREQTSVLYKFVLTVYARTLFTLQSLRVLEHFHTYHITLLQTQP